MSVNRCLVPDHCTVGLVREALIISDAVRDVGQVQRLSIVVTNHDTLLGILLHVRFVSFPSLIYPELICVRICSHLLILSLELQSKYSASCFVKHIKFILLHPL